MATCQSCGKLEADGLLTWETSTGWIWAEALCNEPACVARASARMITAYFQYTENVVPLESLGPDQMRNLAREAERGVRENS